MQQLTRVIAGLAGAAALLLLGLKLVSRPQVAPPSETSSALLQKSQPAKAASKPWGEAPSTTAPPTLTGTPVGSGLTRHAERTKAMHSDELYAAVVRQWNDNPNGGYPTVVALRVACKQAMLTARSSPSGDMPRATGDFLTGGLLPMPGETATNVAQRQAAWERVKQRCLPLLQDDLHMGDPSMGEPFERELDQVRATGDFRQMVALEYTYGRFDQVLMSYHTQGGLADGFIPWFGGQALGGAGRADLYDQALRVAAVMLYADPQSPSPHLYALALCAQKGLCTGSLEERLLADYPAGSPERATIQALYPRMMAAVLRGDLDAFEFRKKP